MGAIYNKGKLSDDVDSTSSGNGKKKLVPATRTFKNEP